MYISEHPLSEIEPLIAPYQQKKIIEISPSMENDFVRIAGIITSVQTIVTRKSNQKMAFIKVEDQSKNIEVLVFPKIFAATPDLFTPDKVVIIDGFVSNKDGELKILAEEIYPVSDKNIPNFSPRTRKRNGFGFNGNGNGGGYSGNNGQDIKEEKSHPKKEPPKFEPEILTISIPREADSGILSEIKEILTTHKGTNKVTIKVPKNGEGWREMKIKNTVDICPPLLRKLKEVVGKENIS